MILFIISQLYCRHYVLITSFFSHHVQLTYFSVALGLALGWLSIRLTVTLGLWLGIGIGVRVGSGIALELGTGIADLNQVTDLKLSILAPIQIADLNLTPSILYVSFFTGNGSK